MILRPPLQHLGSSLVPSTTQDALVIALDLPLKELRRLIPRRTRMTLVQSVLPVHDDIVAHVVDIGSTSSIRDDIDIFKRPIEAGLGFAAVDLDNTFAVCETCKVLQVDVGPFEGTCVGV